MYSNLPGIDTYIGLPIQFSINELLGPIPSYEGRVNIVEVGNETNVISPLLSSEEVDEEVICQKILFNKASLEEIARSRFISMEVWQKVLSTKPFWNFNKETNVKSFSASLLKVLLLNLSKWIKFEPISCEIDKTCERILHICCSHSTSPIRNMNNESDLIHFIDNLNLKEIYKEELMKVAQIELVLSREFFKYHI